MLGESMLAKTYLLQLELSAILTLNKLVVYCSAMRSSYEVYHC